MKKLGSLLLAVVFVSTMFTSCVDATAEDIYDNIVPEKTNNGNASPHHTPGPDPDGD